MNEFKFCNKTTQPPKISLLLLSSYAENSSRWVVGEVTWLNLRGLSSTRQLFVCPTLHYKAPKTLAGKRNKRHKNKKHNL